MMGLLSLVRMGHLPRVDIMDLRPLTHSPSDLTLEIVCGTRYSEDDFWDKSALGQSLSALHNEARIVTRISYANRQGLPELYNRSIAAADTHDILVFMHDDVWLQDYFFVDRIIEGLGRYDVIGVAGTRRRAPRQVSWYINGYKPQPEPDWGYLSGAIGHGQEPFKGEVGVFGPVPAECELLDGVLLAARKSTLRERGVQFDPRFAFHFYDLDFCRTARHQGLRLGTFALSLTHQSQGNFDTQTWAHARDAYWAKWRD